LVFCSLIRTFAVAMNRIQQALVWLGRIGHCRGFGIQSPTDYRFVRYVINERWPYHVYSELPTDDDWLTRKLGKLYLRIANFRQPTEIIDGVGMAPYLLAGCKKAKIVDDTTAVQLALVPIECDYQSILDRCNEQSVVIFQNIHRSMPLWHCIEYDQRVRVTFDLYYCGIAVFDSKRSRQNYIVNF